MKQTTSRKIAIKQIERTNIRQANVQMTLIIEESYFNEFIKKFEDPKFKFYYSTYSGIVSRNKNFKLMPNTKISCVTVTNP